MKSVGGFVVNQGKKEINQIAEYFRPELAPYTEVAGKPVKLEITDFMDYDDDYGYGGVQFYLTRASEDGNYLNPSKLYYNMYLDDEKYTFYPNEYPKLTEHLTDVPYSYSGTDLVLMVTTTSSTSIQRDLINLVYRKSTRMATNVMNRK